MILTINVPVTTIYQNLIVSFYVQTLMLKTNWYSSIFGKKEFLLLRVLALLRILSVYVKTFLTDQSLFDSMMEY